MPVICRNACVGSTGNWLPARISGVAKSASEAAKSSRNALASPGIDSGSVTVRNTRQRDAPSDSAMPSMLESMPGEDRPQREVGDREIGDRLGEQRAGAARRR